MGKKSFFGRAALLALCLAAAVRYPGYRLAQNYVAGRMDAQLRTETESILQALHAAGLQKSVLLRKAAREAGEYWAAGDLSGCRALPAHYVASYDAATGLGLSLSAGESPDKEALAVYAFRDEGRPETLEAFPGDVGDGTPWDGKGPASPRWLPFRRQPLTGAPTVTAACPVYTVDRRQAGIAVLDTDIFEIQKLVTARGLPSSLTADVLDGAGTVLASSRPAALMRPMGQNAPSDLARALETVLAEREGELLYTDGGETIRLVFGTSPETGWKVCMRSRVRDDFRNVKWFWENDIRVYSCCGFHTVRRSAASAGNKNSDALSPGGGPNPAPPGRGRRFSPIPNPTK